MNFISGFSKVAVIDLPDAAAQAYANSFQDYVQGSSLNKETGQAKGRVTRTPGVQNEDKEFSKKYLHDWQNARQPKKEF